MERRLRALVFRYLFGYTLFVRWIFAHVMSLSPWVFLNGSNPSLSASESQV